MEDASWYYFQIERSFIESFSDSPQEAILPPEVFSEAGISEPEHRQLIEEAKEFFNIKLNQLVNLYEVGIEKGIIGPLEYFASKSIERDYLLKRAEKIAGEIVKAIKGAGHPLQLPSSLGKVARKIPIELHIYDIYFTSRPEPKDGDFYRMTLVNAEKIGSTYRFYLKLIKKHPTGKVERIELEYRYGNLLPKKIELKKHRPFLINYVFVGGFPLPFEALKVLFDTGSFKATAMGKTYEFYMEFGGKKIPFYEMYTSVALLEAIAVQVDAMAAGKKFLIPPVTWSPARIYTSFQENTTDYLSPQSF